MSSKERSSVVAGSGAVLVPKLRFPEFQDASAWDTAPGDELFQQVSNREAPPGLPILAITQEHGAIPRHLIDYNVSVTDKSLETYKEVRPGDFIISLRSFQGGIEFSDYHGICSPAYVILRKRGQLSDRFYRQHFKSHAFIQQLTRNLEGLRDGKMISYKQFSELQVLKPTPPEQQKIADCLDSADALIAAQVRKVEVLRTYKKGLMQQLFPQEGETQPRLRFPEFEGAGEWEEVAVSRVAKITTGSRDTQNKVEDGEFPFFVRSQTVERIDSFAFDCEAVLTSGDGVGVGKNFHYIDGKFDFHQRVYCIYDFKKRLRGKFFFYFFSEFFGSRVMKMSAKNSVDSVRMAMIAEMPILLPSPQEQERIANCLTSIDDLIAAETRKLDLLKTHKKGLMQQLFPYVGEADE